MTADNFVYIEFNFEKQTIAIHRSTGTRIYKSNEGRLRRFTAIFRANWKTGKAIYLEPRGSRRALRAWAWMLF